MPNSKPRAHQSDTPNPPDFRRMLRLPLQPATRQIRVLVDTGTLEQSSVEALVALLTRSEIESCLVVQNDDDSPSDWMNALGIDRWYRFHFTTVDEAPRRGDSSVVGVEGFVGVDQVLGATGHFFGVYSQLDHHRGEVAAGHDELSIADRHRAAALASAAGTLGADVIVTGARTAGRHDVADNDIAISLSPDQFTRLFGHYLRITGNRDLEVSFGQLVGGGSYRRTHSARSVTDMYEAGIDASAPHLTAIRVMALGAGDQGLVDSSKTPAPPHTPVSGRVSSTRAAASWSPARAAAMLRTCSYPVIARNVGARP